MASGTLDGRTGALLFGGGSVNVGVLSDTWFFDDLAEAWTKMAKGPKGRGGASLTYMETPLGDTGAEGAFVLFGGEGGALYGDTWLFGDAGWSSLCTGSTNLCSCGPCPRAYQAAAYDPVRRQVMMFGGRNDETSLQDTWVFSQDQIWSERCLSPCSDDADACCKAPSPRSEHALAFDAQRGVAVLFGGKGADGTLLDDTWEWDGSQWIQRQPAHAPEPRSGHVMAASLTSNGVILFGGLDSDYAPIESIWHWDGNDWAKLATRGLSPQSRAFGTMTSVSTGSMLLFGGGSAGDMNDTWLLSFTNEVHVDTCLSSTVHDAGGDAESLTDVCARLASCCGFIPTSSTSQLCPRAPGA
jgi:hypothetical protein